MNFLLVFLFFFTGELSMGREFSRVWSCQRKLCTLGIHQNSCTKFFLYFLLLFSVSILRMKLLRVIVVGEFSPELNIDNISVEEESDCMGLFKKRSEIKQKKNFYAVRGHATSSMWASQKWKWRANTHAVRRTGAACQKWKWRVKTRG